MRVPTVATGRTALMALGTVGIAAAVAGLGTFGSFSVTTSRSVAVAAGTVDIALGGAGTATNRLTVEATGLVPGDVVSRRVRLTNTGNQALAGVALSTTATPATPLSTDATNGLQLVVEACSTGWTESGTAPSYDYTCSGTTSTVLPTRQVAGTNLALAGLQSLAAGGADDLRVRLTLPTTSGNTSQGRTTSIAFSFAATQRVSTNR